MKKLLALLLALMMLFSVATVFAGCEDSGKKKSSSSKKNDDDDDEDEDEDEDDEDEDKDGEDLNDEDKDGKDEDDEDDEDKDKDNNKDNKDDKDDKEDTNNKVDAESIQGKLKKALTKAVDTYYNVGSPDLYGCAPDEVFDYCEDFYEYSMDEIQDAISDFYSYMEEELTDYVGSNYSVTTELMGYEHADEEFLEKCAEALQEDYDLKKSKFTDCYTLFVELTLSGDESSDTDTDDSLIAICYDGQWYIASYYQWDDEDGEYFSCDFLIRDLIRDAAYMLDYPEDYE